MKWVPAAGMLDLTAALDAYQHPRRSRFADNKRDVCNDSHHPEVSATNERFPQSGRRLFHRRRYRPHGTLLKVDAGDCLIRLQGPRLAGAWIDMVPVVEAKGDIAILLDFKYHHVAQ
jgi:hypothetical protein